MHTTSNGLLLGCVLTTSLVVAGCQPPAAKQSAETTPTATVAEVASALPDRAAELYAFVFLTDGPEHGKLSAEEIALAATAGRSQFDITGLI